MRWLLVVMLTMGSLPARAAMLIDDFEDGDESLPSIDGRNGTWYWYNDGTEGSQFFDVVKTPDRPKSKFGLWTAGGDFQAWGAVTAVDLDTGGAYDASAYRGISFWARREPDMTASVRFQIADRYSDERGGFCNPDGGPDGCWDHFGRFVSIGTEWQQYAYRWEELVQQGYGLDRPGLDASAIYSLQFSYGGGDVFELYVDDFYFVE